MKKTLSFFQEKAQSFITRIDDILTNYIEYDVLFKDDPYNPLKELEPYSTSTALTEEVQEKKKRYISQGVLIKDLNFDVKLMFSEFDNGQIFMDRYINMPENGYTFEKDRIIVARLTEMRKTLNLFVDYIDEYRL